jgi:hypothetical protein
MRFEKKTTSVTSARPKATAADNYHVYCCCGKRQDKERSAGRVGKLETLWHCSGCVSVRGRGLLRDKCCNSEEQLRQARVHLKTARGLERLFTERVTDPDRMAKTGEVSAVIHVLLVLVTNLTPNPNANNPRSLYAFYSL